jgi:putative membrane-bound dehydrogenase-like protein
MSLNSIVVVVALIAALLSSSESAIADDKATPLFDGRSLDGWDVIERDRQWWTVADGAITGGSLEQKVPHNTFISTKESFQNFELTLKIQIQGTEGFINSGIQIRSIRVPNSSEMSGYQVDAGDGWWGKIYDESRRNKVVGEAADLEAVNRAVRKGDWNEYRIRAEGRRIRSWINGVAALDYTEQDGNIPLDGHIGVQAHGGGKVLVQFKDIVIERLPPTADAMTWDKLRQAKPEQNDTGIRTPQEELRGFRVPDGFEVELVASESEDIGKFIAVAFDAKGRMWTMTALEYPVDANESPEASRQLFESGGRDKVLVFDQPFGEQVSQPRVFAAGLVMPLGILPYGDGVYVQYGPDIRFYRDTDGDGRADQHEVVLTGFGTQDSHLFPHQFTRAPGGWILAAQGLFNYSKVRRPGDAIFADGVQEIAFNQCKLARFAHDGSRFEALTAGPNNIWGLTVSREGETWIQEANDLGYPIIPYEPGGYYRTGSKEQLRAYQPLMPPPLAPPQMGGTGLSGLALADDTDGWPAPWGANGAAPNAAKIFYVANPITSRIQMIRATPAGPRYRYEKLPDFLISEDIRFRPVAMQFGPDGCLYVTDWYNKIISHNEVPRNHPERDKIRGRIWRIRHQSQTRVAPPDLTVQTDDQLLDHLGAPNSRIADLTWQEIVDRGAKQLVPRLQQLVQDNTVSDDQRLGALWALEGLVTVPTPLLLDLAKDDNANIRRQAVRIAGAQSRPEREFLAVAAPLVDDPTPTVRAALGDALRHMRCSDPGSAALMMKLGRAPLVGDEWDVYDREFERYLARWAMESNPSIVAEFLKSTDGQAMPLDSRVLATLSVGGRDAAAGFARLMPQLDRSLTTEEIRTLATHFAEPDVANAMVQAIGDPASRETTLRALLAIRTDVDTTALSGAIDSAITALWRERTSPQDRQFALQVAGAWRLRSLDADIAAWASSEKTEEESKLAALRALREIGSSQFESLAAIATNKQEHQTVRSAALAALAESPSDAAQAALTELLRELNFEQREPVVQRMASNRRGALALLKAIEAGDILPENLPLSALDVMHTLLPDNAQVGSLWAEFAESAQPVLRLAGGNDDYVRSPITLAGPFSVETWIRLNAGISNADGILGRASVFDLNFHDETFRLWLAGQHDVVIATRKITPQAWTHVAITRDADGLFHIYLNGEVSAESVQKNTTTFDGLRIGQTNPGVGGTDAELFEYRIWNVARSSQQIRDNFDRRVGIDERPEGLIHYFSGAEWGKLAGKARVQLALEAPKLLTVEQATAQAEKFASYRKLTEQPGHVEIGKELFTTQCMACHQYRGTGGNIGPVLDGIGVTSTESLLRHILTPSAAMEGGYRNYRVLTFDGRIVQGFLVSQDEGAVVLRQPNTADQRIAKSDIEHAGFTLVSVMPSGLLEALKPQQVSDLFTYLRSLREDTRPARPPSGEQVGAEG